MYFVKTEKLSNVICGNSPQGYERLLITPGTAKHEKLHDYRDVLLSEYDDAVRAHNRFLFLGFGFNDTQLVNNAITDKLVKDQSDGLIITRDSNSRIEELLSGTKTLGWFVSLRKTILPVFTIISLMTGYTLKIKSCGVLTTSRKK